MRNIEHISDFEISQYLRRNIEHMSDFEIAQYLRRNRNKAVIIWGSEKIETFYEWIAGMRATVNEPIYQ